MWNCRKCGETVDESLGVCWNCGTTSDGVEDPGFVREQETHPEEFDICASCGGELDVINVGGLGVTHCSQCRLLAEMDAEGYRNCPLDDTEMAKLVHRGLIVDRCPVCNGVWLDEGELEAIEDQVRGDPWD